MFFAGVVVRFVLLAAVLLQQLRTVADGYRELLSGKCAKWKRPAWSRCISKSRFRNGRTSSFAVNRQRIWRNTPNSFTRRKPKSGRARRTWPNSAGFIRARITVSISGRPRNYGPKVRSCLQLLRQRNSDFKTADKMVRGQDREATDLFDQGVSRLNDSMELSIAAQKAAVRKSLSLVLAFLVACLLLLDCLVS
jgi:hypothetical protein